MGTQLFSLSRVPVSLGVLGQLESSVITPDEDLSHMDGDLCSVSSGELLPIRI
jgi:hypothetical protein